MKKCESKNSRMYNSFIKSLLFCCLPFIFNSCASYEKFKRITEESEFPAEVFNFDYNQSWQATLEAMKRFDLAVQNQETGTIKTRWMDNTKELNFANSFSNTTDVKAARFRLQVNVVKGFKGDREVTKVTFFKRQLIEQDFLQGWKEEPSDGITERVLLYRIGRILERERKLDLIQKRKEKKQLESF